MIFSSTRNYKKIGILGGMGPEATAELYLRIVRIFQKKYGAKYDCDFPEMIICNLPLLDVVEGGNKDVEVENMLVYGVRKLEAAGADFIAIPCNTVTYYLPTLRRAVAIPILSILEETASAVKEENLSCVGLLATRMTLETGIYEEVLGEVELVKPTPQQVSQITKVIMNILSGKKKRNDYQALVQIVQELQQRRAQKVILGCTELPLLIGQIPETIDTIEVLAKAVVKRAIDI